MKIFWSTILVSVAIALPAEAAIKCTGAGSFTKTGKNVSVEIKIAKHPNGVTWMTLSLNDSIPRGWDVDRVQPIPGGDRYVFGGDFRLDILDVGTADLEVRYPASNKLEAPNLTCSEIKDEILEP